MIEFVLECQALTKRFQDGEQEIKVLNQLDLQVPVGQSLAIIGRSGSGKTTLLQILGGLDKPSSGQVLLNGRDLARMNEAERSRARNSDLGFIYQFHHLLKEFTALENIALPALIRGDDPSQAKRRAQSLLDKVQLSHRAKHQPGQLSGGERQRVAIARALVNEPRCVLADEPTGNLDDDNARQILKLITELQHELSTSFIIVTHDLNISAQLDQAFILKEGRLLKQ